MSHRRCKCGTVVNNYYQGINCPDCLKNNWLEPDDDSNTWQWIYKIQVMEFELDYYKRTVNKLKDELKECKK